MDRDTKNTTHHYNTRSKNIHLKKSKRMSSDDETDSDVDEYGNIYNLIDYSYSPKRSRHSRNRDRDRDGESDPKDFMNNLLLINAIRMLANKRINKDSDYDSYSEYELEDKEEEYTYEEKRYLKKLPKQKQKYYENQEEKIGKHNNSIVPLRFKILELPLSTASKSSIMNKYKSFSKMEETDNEYHKLNTWFSDFNKIPFQSNIKFPLKVTSDDKTICSFFTNTRNILDETVYGHDHVKDTIIQILSQWFTNPRSKGTVIALQGPMGNGKTTLVKHGLSKVLHRPFSLIALGGAKDSSFLQGHEYTYEGAKCGRIVEILQETQCMNPIIFFDELDKLSDTANGAEISQLLCHLMDPVQNTNFHDRYFSGIDFDLSKCIFVVSFNDESKINSILKDRMNVIHMKGYTLEDKIQIANRHLIPKLCKELNFPMKYVNISEENIKHIVNNYTDEEGVRMLRLHLNILLAKLNTIKLLTRIEHDNPTEILSSHLTISFPIETLENDLIDKLLKDKNNKNTKTESMQYLYM